MKKFFTVVLGSFVGTWLALMISSVLSIVLSFMMLGMMSNASSSKVALSDNSILHIDLGTAITERSTDDDVMSMVMGNGGSTVGLDQMLSAILAAKTNDKVKGIIIDCNGVQAGVATLKEVRDALSDFACSDKFVYAYGYSGIAQADYYVASVADSIFISPYTSVDIHGLAAQNLFFKNLLDKIGVEMQVIRVGTFKSAVEPYMLTEISEANRMQQEHYLGSIWSCMLSEMAGSRRIESKQLNALADSMLVAKDHNYLLKYKLIDGVCYRTEMESKLKVLTCGEDGDLNLITPADMPLAKVPSGKKEISVVYAVGEIDGNSTEGIDSQELVKTINELAKDDDVAAMVLRVNSPGGSAFGSEQIWKAIEDFKKKDKKVVVSMGDYAASGGYYISSGADYIVAEPTTITGSIGIFGVIPCAETLVEDKLGINQCVVKTNANGEFGSLITRMTPAQRDAMQQMVNNGYELFTSRCATGRNVPIDSIKSIAEGRVWDGTSAFKIGLVDKLGSMKYAISKAAELAKCEGDYSIATYPEVKTRWQRMIEKYAMARYEAQMRSEFGELCDYQKVLKRVLGRDKVLCLMEPCEIIL